MTCTAAFARVVLACGALACAGEASGQVLTVTVTTSDGAPVAGASVALWEGTVQRLSGETRSDGRLHLQRTHLPALSAISVRAIGFRPVSLPLPARDSIVVRLAMVPHHLPEVVASAPAATTCQPDEAVARRIWTTAAASYSLLPVDRAYSARGAMSAGTGPRSEMGKLAPARATSWAVSGMAREQTERFIADSGYAIRRRPGHPVGVVDTDDFGPWWFPRLHTWASDHFARDSFGKANAFQVVDADSAGWTIGFCSGHGKRPSIAGTMRIDIGHSFVGAEWSFNTRKPATIAGGEITFLAGTRAGLVPVVGRFWKLADGNGDAAMVYYEDFSGAAWELGEGPDVHRDGPARTFHREGTHTP